MRLYTHFVSGLAAANMTSPSVSKVRKTQDAVANFGRGKGEQYN
jgi:hypothetical protein